MLHGLLTSIDSDMKSSITQIITYLCARCCFPLATFRTLSLVFSNLIRMCLSIIFFRFIHPLFMSLICKFLLFTKFVLGYYFFKYFLFQFLFSPGISFSHVRSLYIFSCMPEFLFFSFSICFALCFSNSIISTD